MNLTKIWDFIKRHSLPTIAGMIGILLIIDNSKIISYMAFCLAIESLAIVMSSLAAYAYTKSKFDEIRLSEVDTASYKGLEIAVKEYEVNAKVLSAIFISVHFLLGFMTLIFYSDTFK